MPKRRSIVALGVVLVFGLSACGNAGPNYDLAPTIACLRNHGDKVFGPYRRDFEGTANPMIEVHTRLTVDLLSFAPSAAKAAAESKATNYGLVTSRNVVFDIEGISGLSPHDAPIVNCLQSR